MQITLSYSGYLKLPGVENGSQVEVEEDSTVGDILSSYGIPVTQQRFLTTFVNDEPAELSSALQDNDDLAVIIQVGGG